MTFYCIDTISKVVSIILGVVSQFHKNIIQCCFEQQKFIWSAPDDIIDLIECI